MNPCEESNELDENLVSRAYKITFCYEETRRDGESRLIFGVTTSMRSVVEALKIYKQRSLRLTLASFI